MLRVYICRVLNKKLSKILYVIVNLNLPMYKISHRVKRKAGSKIERCHVRLSHLLLVTVSCTNARRAVLCKL